MATHEWMFEVTDLQGNVLGDVTNASQRVLTLPLNRVPTAAFQIPIQHYLSKYLLDVTWDGLVKVYRDRVLRFCGPVVSSAEAFDAANNQSIVVNAASPLWRLQFRYLGKTNTGWSLGDASTPYDLGFIAQQMLAAANASGWTGILPGSNVPSTSGSAGVYYFKDVLTALGEISTGYNSFDFEVVPTEPTNLGLGFPQIGTFNTTNLIGSQRTNAIFEFGTTKANVDTYGRNIDRSKRATRGYMEQPASTNHSGILQYEDTAASAQYGVYETLVDNGGVQWDNLRMALIQQNVLIRKNARQVITFNPAPNCTPTAFTDFIVGDQIRARIVVNDLAILDGMMRVWGITFNIDNNGNEAMALELIQP